MSQAASPRLPESCLYVGEVMHCRLRPFHHRFVYSVFSLFVELDRLPVMAKRLRFLSLDRFNLLGFHKADHGPRDGSDLRPWLDGQLAAAGIQSPSALRIFVLSFPRVLGYTFNPITVYYAYRPDGRLVAMVYEVKNTFGEQHAYTLPAEPGAGGMVRHGCDKTFYVSPFIQMDAHYEFRLRPPGERLFFSIAESVPDGKQLLASQTGQSRPLRDSEILRALFRTGFLTFKVIAGIHWEASRLWWKGATYYPHGVFGRRRPPLPSLADEQQPRAS